MLNIGPIRLTLPAVQAALSGYSDRPMRIVARRWGAELALAEVVLDETLLVKGRLRDRLLDIGPDDHPVGGQLMGADPAKFGAAADELVRAGVDLVDINFGCPVKKVLGRCRGGYLLTEPETALDIVKSVIDTVAGRTPVTVKMRRGYDDSAESEANFFRILDGAFDRGAAAVTVHGRTVLQRYVGPSNRDFLGKVKRHVGSKTILGSGDVFTAEAAVGLMRDTGIDGVTVARGAIGNPFIFREIRALLAGLPMPPPATVAEQRQAMEEHFRLAVGIYGSDRAGRIMRKFCIRFADLHPDRVAVRQAFIESVDTASVNAAIAKWYDSGRDWPVPERRDHLEDLIAAGAAE